MSHSELISLPPNWSSQRAMTYGGGPAAAAVAATLTLPPPPKTRYEDEIDAAGAVVVRHSLHVANLPASSAPTSFLHGMSISHPGEMEKVE